VNAGDTGFDIGLHYFEAVERPAETRFRIGDDRGEPVALGTAFAMLDLVSALKGAVDPLRELRARVRWVERLVGVHGASRVCVRRCLPAGQIDRLQARADHLHGLVARHCAERPNGFVLLQKLPQPQRSTAR
jgi:hypothetical protein